jgi:hypothetical protein
MEARSIRLIEKWAKSWSSTERCSDQHFPTALPAYAPTCKIALQLEDITGWDPWNKRTRLWAFRIVVPDQDGAATVVGFHQDFEQIRGRRLGDGVKISPRNAASGKDHDTVTAKSGGVRGPRTTIYSY